MGEKRRGSRPALCFTSGYLSAKLNKILLVSFRVMAQLYSFPPAGRPLVPQLKIHCWFVESQRKLVSGVVELMVSSTGLPVFPLIVQANGLDVTTPAVPIETPFASQNRNLTGMVLPPLNTLNA